MKVELLKDLDAEKAKSIIMSSDDIANSIFVLDCNTSLYQYIDNLELGNVTLFKLKICKEIKNLNAQYDNGKEIKSVQTFSGLLEMLDTSKVTYIIVKGDLNQKDEKVKELVRTKVNDVVQQLIYLNMPLEKIQVITENEHKNIEKAKQFEKTLKKHKQNVQKAIDGLMIPSKLDVNGFKEIKQDIQSSLQRIDKELNNVKSDEIKIAVVYKNKCKEFQTLSEVKKYLLNLFKNSEIEVNYLSSEKKSSYDTSEIDLAKADKETVQKVINNVDIVVFIIDYLKANLEMNYLQTVKEICEEKHKFYSFIFDINKLDLRYNSDGDKNTIRALDFIREKLISISTKFKDSIVIGTSAFTYFNCIETIKFRNYKVENLDSYTLFQNTHNVQESKLNNVEQLKQTSGVPNLFNYINYTAQNKAKIERINNIIYNIDQEHNYISNLFHFNEIKKSLEENVALLDKSLSILDKLSKSVLAIFDEDTDDVYKKYKNQELKSHIIEKIACTRPLKFKIGIMFEEMYIDKMLNSSSIINDVVFRQIRTMFSERINELFEQSNITKKIDGEKRRIITENQILKCIVEVAFNIENLVNTTIEDRIKQLRDCLTWEQKNIQEDLENITTKRVTNVYDIIEKCEKDLNEKCNLSFSLRIPNFDFETAKDEVFEIQEVNIDFGDLEENLNECLKRNMPYNKIFGLDGDDIMRIFGKIFLNIRNQSKINKICYDSNSIMELYDNREKGLASFFRNTLIQSDIEQSYKETKDKLIKYLKDFTQEIENEMEDVKSGALQLASGAKKSMDHTNEYAVNIEYLKDKRVLLETINCYVKDFCNDWKLL